MDREGKVEKALDRFFAPVLGREMIGAANAMKTAASVALANPI